VIDALGDRQPHVMLPTPLAHGHGPIAAIGRQVRRPAAAPDVDRLEQGGTTVHSCCCPAVTWKAVIVPRASHVRWSFEPQPPRERPRA
jgi:hypothetical protein